MNSKDAKLLRRYARYMFERALVERAERIAEESNLLIAPRPKKDWLDSQAKIAIESDGHRKLVAWFEKLSPADRVSARKRLARELEQGAKA